MVDYIKDHFPSKTEIHKQKTEEKGEKEEKQEEEEIVDVVLPPSQEIEVI
jgi:hypothetical protein